MESLRINVRAAELRLRFARALLPGNAGPLDGLPADVIDLSGAHITLDVVACGVLARLRRMETSPAREIEAVGRADKAMPVGTCVRVEGIGVGLYQGLERRLRGANHHRLLFDDGTVRTLQLRDQLWCIAGTASITSHMDPSVTAEKEEQEAELVTLKLLDDAFSNGALTEAQCVQLSRTNVMHTVVIISRVDCILITNRNALMHSDRYLAAKLRCIETPGASCRGHVGLGLRSTHAVVSNPCCAALAAHVCRRNPQKVWPS
eukprot:COSAG01_NODE_4608_length_4882_cov_13.337863_2_plen_262_part_00